MPVMMAVMLHKAFMGLWNSFLTWPVTHSQKHWRRLSFKFLVVDEDAGHDDRSASVSSVSSTNTWNFNSPLTHQQSWFNQLQATHFASVQTSRDQKSKQDKTSSVDYNHANHNNVYYFINSTANNRKACVGTSTMPQCYKPDRNMATRLPRTRH